MKQIINFFLAFFLFVGMSSCSKLGNSKDAVILKFKEEKGEPIAKVGGFQLTLEELSEDFLSRQGAMKGMPQLNTERKRKDYVESQVVQEAMFQEAVATGYVNNPEIKKQIKKIVTQEFIKDKLSDLQKNYEPSEEDMLEYYNNNLNLYKREESLRALFAEIPFGNDKAAAQKIANDLQAEMQKNINNANKRQFAKIAMDAAAKKLPSIGSSMTVNETSYMEKESFEKKFGKNTFEDLDLNYSVGEIAKVKTGENSFYVLMKTGKRKKLDQSFEDAKEKIAKRISFENRGKFYENLVANLKKKYKVKIFDEHMAQLGQNLDEESGGEN